MRQNIFTFAINKYTFPLVPDAIDPFVCRMIEPILENP